jgi:hypothetical protein
MELGVVSSSSSITVNLLLFHQIIDLFTWTFYEVMDSTPTDRAVSYMPGPSHRKRLAIREWSNGPTFALLGVSHPTIREGAHV